MKSIGNIKCAIILTNAVLKDKIEPWYDKYRSMNQYIRCRKDTEACRH